MPPENRRWQLAMGAEAAVLVSETGKRLTPRCFNRFLCDLVAV
jgi:hypothetical protein